MKYRVSGRVRVPAGHCTRAPSLVRGDLNSEQLLLRRTNYVVSHSWSCVQVMGVLGSGVGWRGGGIIVLVVDILIFWKGMDEKKKDIRFPICSYFLSWFHRNFCYKSSGGGPDTSGIWLHLFAMTWYFWLQLFQMTWYFCSHLLAMTWYFWLRSLCIASNT